MITEDYVSFEVAKLMKEKGFDEETEHKMWYVIKQFSTGCHWNSCTYKVGDITREYVDDCCIAMSTLQMAMKWLRESHNIFIGVNTVIGGDKNWGYEVFIQKQEVPIPSKMQWDWFNTYEEACEAGIKYCLENLI